MVTRSAVAAPVERIRPPRHVGRNKELEDWLDGQGVQWQFHPDVPLDAFNETDSLGNQVRFVPIIPDTVDQYAVALKDGAVFPPILVFTKRGKFVRLDGNHRVAAKRKAGQETVHAYEAMVTGSAATALAFKANNRNGLPNTEEERIHHGIWLLRNGASIKTAAAEAVVAERVLTAWPRNTQRAAGGYLMAPPAMATTTKASRLNQRRELRAARRLSGVDAR